MNSNTDVTGEEGAVVRVTRKGQATIPQPLRERFGIETPGQVFIHQEGERIVVEPLPSVERLRGIHADRYAEGEALEHVRALRAADRRLERERARGRPADPGSSAGGRSEGDESADGRDDEGAGRDR